MTEPSQTQQLRNFGDLLRQVLSKCPEQSSEVCSWVQQTELLLNRYEVPPELRVDLLLPYLSSHCRRVVTGMPSGSLNDFASFKDVIFREYNLTPAQNRENFFLARKGFPETYQQYSTRLTSLWDTYLRSRKVDPVESICKLIVSDKLRDAMSPELKAHILNSEQESWLPPDKMSHVADVFESHRRDKFRQGIDSTPSPHRFDRFSIDNHKRPQHFSRFRSRSESFERKPFQHGNAGSKFFDSPRANNFGTQNNNRFRNSKYNFNNRLSSGTSQGTYSRPTERQGYYNNNNGRSNNFDSNNKSYVSKGDTTPKRVMRVGVHCVDNNDCMSLNNFEYINNHTSCVVEDGCRSLYSIAEKDEEDFDEGQGQEFEVECSELQEVNLVVNGVQVRGICDSGASISCIRQDCLTNFMGCDSDRTVTLKSAFGDGVVARLSCLDVSFEGCDRRMSLVWAISPRLAVDCLISQSDYDKLCRSSELRCEDTPTTNVYKVDCSSDVVSNDVITPDLVQQQRTDSQISRDSESVDLCDTFMGSLDADVSLMNKHEVHKFVLPTDDHKADVDAFRCEQLDCSTLTSIFEDLKGTGRSLSDEGYFVNPSDRLLYHTEVVNNYKVNQLVVPKSRRVQVLKLAHEMPYSGHLGLDKTLYRIKLTFYWPHLRQDVERFCTACEACQLRRRRTVYDNTVVHPIPRAGEAFDVMHADVLGPIDPPSKQYKYILCVVCSYSRWVECVGLTSLSAQATVEAFLKVFSRMSIPSVIVTDNGTNFSAGLTVEFHKMIGVCPRFITPSCAASNGLAERQIGNIKRCLHHVIKEVGGKWMNYLHLITWGLRDVPNSTTGVSPTQMVFGKQGRGPLHVLKQSWSEEGIVLPVGSKAVGSFLAELRDRLGVAAHVAGLNSDVMQARYCKYANKHTRPKQFEVGDKCVVLEETSTNKIKSEWKGPCVIVDRVSNNSYMVDIPGGGRRKLPASKLRYFHPPFDDYRSESLQDISFVDCSVDGSVNLVGVIHEDGTDDFGDIVEMPQIDNNCNTDTGVDLSFEDQVLGLIDSTCMHLSQGERSELCEVLLRHSNVFGSRPGSCNMGEHSIEVDPNAPVPRRRLYPVPLVFRAEVDTQIGSMLQQGLIEPSLSSYAHPVVCVKKKDGTLRLAVDYRAVNSITRNTEYPMPNIAELLLQVGSAKYISTLDATQGYYQIPLADDGSRERSAFMTHSGLWQFRVMPFGLKCAAATYQRVMNHILQGLSYSSSYQDDTNVASDTWSSHMHHLDVVLQRIEDSGLKLKLSKCNFAQQKVKYLGHIIGGGEHTPDTEKLQAVLEWNFPESKKRLRSMLGLISYYRMYVPNFASVVRPLTELTRGKGSSKLDPPGPEALSALEAVAFLCLECVLHPQ